MEIYHLLNLIFYLEVLFMLLILVSIIFYRAFSKVRTKIELRRKKKLSDEILASLIDNKNIDHLRGTKELLSVLTTYNLLLKGKKWTDLTNHIGKVAFEKKVTRWAKSTQVEKIKRAALLFHLSNDLVNYDILLEMMKNPSFQVRKQAALTLLSLGNEKGILLALSQMSKEEGYHRYIYTDMFVNGPSSALDVVYVMAKKDDDEKILQACLEILSLKTVMKEVSFIANYTKSMNPEIRKAAYKALLKNPSSKNASIFLSGMKDEVSSIRAFCADALSYFKRDDSEKALRTALYDVSWEVRLQAAKSLKKIESSYFYECEELKNYVMRFG